MVFDKNAIEENTIISKKKLTTEQVKFYFFNM